MKERNVVLDQQQAVDEESNALRVATERAEVAEAELMRLKAEKESGGLPVRTSEASKQPPSRSTGNSTTAAGKEASLNAGHHGSTEFGGVEELRKDSMMAHLLDSLDMGKDIGHYGRLIFAMVARHFIPHEEVLAYLNKDKDFSEEQALQMLRQVEARDYTPPKRERIVEWQSEQEFPILPNPDDPDCGNLYRNLKFRQRSTTTSATIKRRRSRLARNFRIDEPVDITCGVGRSNASRHHRKERASIHTLR